MVLPRVTPCRVGPWSIWTPLWARMSADLRTWSQSSSQNAKWCSAPFGPLTIAMSCGRVRALHPHAELVAVAVEDLLGHPEAEHVLEERVGLADLLGVDEHVVHPRRRDAGQVGRRHRRGVELAEDVAELLEVPDQLHGLAAGDLELDRLPLPDLLAAADPAYVAAGVGEPDLELAEVVLALDAEGELVHPDPRVGAQPERVVVLLVPALEVDGVVGALGDVQPEDLGVVGRGQLEIGRPDVDVGESENSHGCLIPSVGRGGRAASASRNHASLTPERRSG